MDLELCGVFGTMDDAMAFVRNHEDATNTHYVTKKRKKAGNN